MQKFPNCRCKCNRTKILGGIVAIFLMKKEDSAHERGARGEDVMIFENIVAKNR